LPSSKKKKNRQISPKIQKACRGIEVHTGYVPEVTNHGLVIDEFSLFSSLLVSFYVQVLLKSNMQTTKLDIWSAGVSLLQLVAGKAPFPSSSSEQ